MLPILENYSHESSKGNKLKYTGHFLEDWNSPVNKKTVSNYYHLVITYILNSNSLF